MTPNIKQIIAEMRENVRRETELNHDVDCHMGRTIKYTCDCLTAILDYVESLENEVAQLENFDPDLYACELINKISFKAPI